MQIEDYKAINHPVLKASFTVHLPEWQGFIIRECKLFESGSRRWVQLPSREYEKDGKKKYWPYVAFKNREREDAFKNEVMQTLTSYLAMEGTPFPPPIPEEEMPF